jgi:hypothetical protein
LCTTAQFYGRRTELFGYPHNFFGQAQLCVGAVNFRDRRTIFLGGAQNLLHTRTIYTEAFTISWESHKICWIRAQLFGKRTVFLGWAQSFWTYAQFSGHAHKFSVQHTIFWEVKKIFWIRDYFFLTPAQFFGRHTNFSVQPQFIGGPKNFSVQQHNFL